MSIEIKKNDPAPASVLRGGSKYPFFLMDVGDSFYIPMGVLPATVRTAASRFQVKHPDRKFTVSKVEGKVYRIA